MIPVLDYLSEWLNRSWSTFSYVVIIYSAGLLLERLYPLERKFPARAVLFNFMYLIIFVLLTQLLVPIIGLATKPLIKALHGGWITIPSLDGIGLQILLAVAFVITFDFFYYWFHRLQHQSSWLWSQHKLHHSEQHLNVTTTNRHHWLEEPFRALLLFPFFLLGFAWEPMKIPWILSAFFLWGFFIHMNIRVNFGPVNYLVVTPQVHRIHHSVEPRHRDKNFAAFLPLWDMLFGTYHRVEAKHSPEVGLSSGERIENLWVAVISPFREWLARLRRGKQREKLN